MAQKHRRKQVIFRKDKNIGAADAESDQLFLDNCFVETGDLAILRDPDGPKRILLGRTGTGKTALVQQLQKTEDHVIELPPEVLSLNHISNSDIIQFFEELGIKLDQFYTLLWRHVITVELLKAKYKIKNERSMRDFLRRITYIFERDKAKERALHYLEEWGEKFWEETEYRVKELTSKMETQLTGSVTAQLRDVRVGAGAARTLTEEQKGDIKNRAQNVVNQVQIKQLRDVIELLAEDIFNDPQQRYFVVIDRLDEEWVEDRVKYKLIKSLIEAVRAFRKVRPVKIIMVLRNDLLQRVLQDTKTAGFQEEKYETLYLRIRWTAEQLEELLDKRIDFLFRDQYTKQRVKIRDILPKNQMEKKAALGYILSRTFLRPRDVILFINECIEKAEGKSIISTNILRSAEMSYSQKRLISLEDEWRTDFPNLGKYVNIRKSRNSPYCYENITQEEIDNFALTMVENTNDPIYGMIERYCENHTYGSELLNQLFRYLYQVGVIGVKLEPFLGTHWSHTDEPVLSETQLRPTCPLSIHPCFWMGLGISGK